MEQLPTLLGEGKGKGKGSMLREKPRIELEPVARPRYREASHETFRLTPGNRGYWQYIAIPPLSSTRSQMGLEGVAL